MTLRHVIPVAGRFGVPIPHVLEYEPTVAAFGRLICGAMSRPKDERELGDFSPVAVLLTAGSLRRVMHMSETTGSNDHAAPSLRNSRLRRGPERVFPLRVPFFRLVPPRFLRFARRRAARCQNRIAEADVHV